MKKGNMQFFFFKSIKFLRNDAQKREAKTKKKKKKKKETREILKQKPIWSKTAHCSKCTLHVYYIFGNARRNEIISTEELAKKLWAIVW